MIQNQASKMFEICKYPFILQQLSMITLMYLSIQSGTKDAKGVDS